MGNCTVTRHANKRTRKRVGIPQKAVYRNARSALERGLGYAEAKGGLKRYIGWLYSSYNGAANNIRIYNNYVYIFRDDVLITVLNLPPEHRAAATYQQRKVNHDG